MNNFTLIKDTYPYYWIKKSTTTSTKTPLIYIHGFGDTPRVMMPLLMSLEDRDVYCIELPGHYETPCSNKKELKPYIFAQHIKKLIETLQLKEVYLMGHSMGGGISLMLAHQIPHIIKKLILISPMNYKGCGPKETFNVVFRFTPSNEKKARAFWKILLKKEHIDEWHQKYSPSLIKNYHARKHNYIRLGFSLASINNLRHLKEAEKNISVDTLLLLGEHDGCISCSRTSKSLTKKIKDIKVKVFQNSGHICFNEEPHLFIETLKSFID